MALTTAERARSLDLRAVAERAKRSDEAAWVCQWPGEHYRFLAALVQVLEARAVVEIGTYTGLSALTFLHALPEDGRLVSFDVVPWNQVPDSALRQGDFGARFEQRLSDLSDTAAFAAHRDIIRAADIVFIDGPKDRRFERTFLSHLLPELKGSDSLLVLDDIRVLEMIDVWEWIDAPKLDCTSLGHWSGTGLVAPR